MKRIYLWFTAIVVVSILSLTGCRKEKDTVNPDLKNKTRKHLPAKIWGANTTTTYTYYNTVYDSTGIIRNITKAEGSNIYKYELVNPREPRELNYFVNGELSSKTIYALNANRNVTRGDVYTTENDWEDYILIARYTLTYNSSNKITQLSYFKANGEKDFDESFEYSPNGNISKIARSGDTILEYDNFNGIGKSVENAYLFYIEGGDHMLFYDQNNLTKAGGSTRSYKYNEDKYPTEMTVADGDKSDVYKIEYIVK